MAGLMSKARSPLCSLLREERMPRILHVALKEDPHLKQRLGVLSLVCIIVLVAVAAWAQSQPGTVSRVYLIKVTPGMEADWLEGAKEHVEWHRHSAGDSRRRLRACATRRLQPRKLVLAGQLCPSRPS